MISFRNMRTKKASFESRYENMVRAQKTETIKREDLNRMMNDFLSKGGLVQTVEKGDMKPMKWRNSFDRTSEHDKQKPHKQLVQFVLSQEKPLEK